MRRTIGIVIGIGLLALGGLAVLSWQSNRNRETTVETFLDVTELDLDLENGTVEVTAGDETVVEMTVSTGFLAPTVDLVQEGGLLRLVQDCPGLVLGWGCRADFQITVTSGTVIGGGTSNGGMSLVGLDGEVDLETSNGEISLANLSSDVTVHTSNGEITGVDLRTARLDASTSNGAIELGFADAPSAVTLDTSNGEVLVELPPDSPAFATETSTSNGTVTVEIRTDPAAAERIEIETSNGDITLRYAD